MKKFVLVFALVLAMALASVAYASTFSTYQAWDEAYNISISGLGNETPHMGYLENTEKCAVCHAVHKASMGGQLLLRGLAGDACTYCHINTTIGGKVLYGGTAGNTYAAADDANSHTFTGSVGTDTGSVRCIDCHSVHGANTYSGGGNIATKILRAYDASAGIAGVQQAITIDAAAQTHTSGTTKFTQETAFCSQCHPYFTTSSPGTITVTFGYGSGQTGDFQAHPMKNLDAVFAGNGATYNGQVAWENSDTCRLCHDGGLVDQGAGAIANSFPHRSTAVRFLKSAANFGAIGASVDATMSSQDGICLKCHKNDATTGVGQTF